MEKYGIKETKELALFGFAVAKGIKASLADGKLSILDVFNFRGALKASEDAFAGIEKVPSELLDLSPEELGELELFTLEHLKGLAPDQWQTVFKAAVDIGLGIMKLKDAITE